MHDANIIRTCPICIDGYMIYVCPFAYISLYMYAYGYRRQQSTLNPRVYRWKVTPGLCPSPLQRSCLEDCLSFPAVLRRSLSRIHSSRCLLACCLHLHVDPLPVCTRVSFRWFTWRARRGLRFCSACPAASSRSVSCPRETHIAGKTPSRLAA